MPAFIAEFGGQDIAGAPSTGLQSPGLVVPVSDRGVRRGDGRLRGVPVVALPHEPAEASAPAAAADRRCRRGWTMSSATSIKRARGVPLTVEPPPGTPAVRPAAGEDAGFRPWHFFVLASLMAATAAVILSRRSTPEHLILISLTIGAAGAAAAGVYRMLAPLAARCVAVQRIAVGAHAAGARTRETADDAVAEGARVRSRDGQGVGQRLRGDGRPAARPRPGAHEAAGRRGHRITAVIERELGRASRSA